MAFEINRKTMSLVYSKPEVAASKLFLRVITSSRKAMFSIGGTRQVDAVFAHEFPTTFCGFRSSSFLSMLPRFVCAR
jgi:hypothetical protein